MNLTKLAESAENEPREALKALYVHAAVSPETFGRIRLFHFKPLAGSVLAALPAQTHTMGVLGFYLGSSCTQADERIQAAQALERFLYAYLQQNLTGPIEDAEFVELASSEHGKELHRASDELARGVGGAIMLAFQTQADAETAAAEGVEPLITGDSDPDFDEEVADLERVFEAFAERATTPGLWDQRLTDGWHDKAKEIDVFTLIAGCALAELVPLRAEDAPLSWDSVGIEVYAIEGPLSATLAVLYTGDPTAIYAGLHVPEGLAPDDERLDALIDVVEEFADLSGWHVGRPQSTQSDTVVRITDVEHIHERLRAGLGQAPSNVDLFAADAWEDRPTNLSFESLVHWALGSNPHCLADNSPGNKAPRIDGYRVYRHRAEPLATILVVNHSQNRAANVAVCMPPDMPEEIWPEGAYDETNPNFIPPETFVEVPAREAPQQLRRALTALNAEAVVWESYNVLGTATVEIRRALAAAVAQERFDEFLRELVTFNGIARTWLRGEEELRSRPASFIAQHREDPQFLMLGAGFSEAEGLRTYLLANTTSKVDPLAVIERLNECGPELTVQQVLAHAGFTLLESEAARASLMSALERLALREAQIYELAPADRVH